MTLLMWVLGMLAAAPRIAPAPTEIRFLAADSVSLAGHWYAGKIDSVAVVIGPRTRGGEAERKKAIDAFQRSGYSVLTFDYRDVDPSTHTLADSVAGLVYASRWVDDMSGALSYARSRIGPFGRLFAWGQMVGGPVAVAAAARSRDACDAVVTEGMFRTAQEYTNRIGTAVSYDVLALHRRLVQPADEPVSACGRLTAPLYVVMAGRDSLTPNAITKELYRGRRARTDLLILPDADHDNAADDPKYFESVTRWLRAMQMTPRGSRRPR